jgi:hypothetical protein
MFVANKLSKILDLFSPKKNGVPGFGKKNELTILFAILPGDTNILLTFAVLVYKPMP